MFAKEELSLSTFQPTLQLNAKQWTFMNALPFIEFDYSPFINH